MNLKPVLLLTLLGLLAGADSLRADGAGLPPADEVLKKFLERAKWADTQNFRGKYVCRERRVTEELNDKGSVAERKEQLFEVKPIGGKPFARLVQSNGKPLTPKEQLLQEEKEKKFRERLAEKKPPADGRKELKIDQSIVSRYHFAVARRDIINGRPALLLTFKPRPNLPETTMEDKFLNRMSGEAWIDEQEYELARLEVRLQESVGILAGILGALQKMVFIIEQQRLPDGVWLPGRSAGEVHARKLFSLSRTKFLGQWSDFRRVEGVTLP